MKNILTSIIIFYFFSCVLNKTMEHKSDIKYKLSNGSAKYWNIQPDITGEYKSDCWIFRLDSTFSFYDSYTYRIKNKVEIIKWYSNDIKIGDDGVIPYKLANDTIEVFRENFKILKLTEDTLVLKKLSNNNQFEILSFNQCKGCKK